MIWVSGDLENQSSLKELVADADVIINVAGLVKAKNRDDILDRQMQHASEKYIRRHR